MKLLKLIYFLILFSLASASPAQKLIPKGKRECGTVVTERQKQAELAREASDFYELNFAPQANRPVWVPMTIHIVRRDDGTGGLTLENLQVAFQDLNRLWLPVGMQFYQHGNIDYINSNFYYTTPDSQIARDNLRRINPVADTVNVYFVGELTSLCGQASFTTDDPQGVLMDNDCAGAGNSPSTWAHEVGHYFDLYHTHETQFGIECPSGNNCSTTGDKICDTPADPTLDYENNVNTSCAWTGSATPPGGCGSTAYNPPTRNIMSYSRRTCRDQFTANQNTKSFGTLITVANRINLMQALMRYVAPDGGSTAICSYQSPCRTLSRAFEVANSGNTIFALAGSYPFTFTSPPNKAITIRKWNTDVGDPIFGF